MPLLSSQNAFLPILYIMPTSEIKQTMDKPPSTNFSKSRGFQDVIVIYLKPILGLPWCHSG